MCYLSIKIGCRVESHKFSVLQIYQTFKLAMVIDKIW